MSETVTLTPKILELNETSNDIYMTVKLCILSNQVNYNSAKFTDDFIQGVIDNKSMYVGIPLVANRVKLENKVYDKLTHEFSNGKLNTDMIGSFIDFWEETDETDAKLLMGEARIYKRFPSVCEAMMELNANNDLEFSCEVLVNSYESVEDGVRTIHYNSGANALIASCVVSDPAESRSKATLLVAEALEKDLQNLSEKGDGDMSKTPETEVFNKGNETRFHGTLETASLKFSDVRDIIYNTLNPVNPKTNYRQYNYWISDLYVGFVIVEEWEDSSTLWKINYSLDGDNVTLESQDKWIKGYKGFIPDGISIDSLTAQMQQQATELSEKINELNEQLKEANTMTEEQVKELQSKLDEATAKVDELNSKVTELNETIVSQEEAKKTLEGTVTELNSQIEDLSKYKEQVETAEKESKKEQLVEKFSKLLSEDTLKSERVQNAFIELNEVELAQVVVEEVMKQKTVETSSQATDVVVTAAKTQDLIPQDISSKYGLSI